MQRIDPNSGGGIPMGAAKHWIPVALAALLLAALPDPASARGRHGRGHGHGHGHHHSGRVWFGFGLPYYYWAPPIYVGPRYYAPYPLAYPPYPAYAPSVVVQEPPVYIQREPAGSWYYCESAGAYYPDVETCAEPWVRVPARD
jgi:hypothetical protein